PTRAKLGVAIGVARRVVEALEHERDGAGQFEIDAAVHHVTRDHVDGVTILALAVIVSVRRLACFVGCLLAVAFGRPFPAARAAASSATRSSAGAVAAAAVGARSLRAWAARRSTRRTRSAASSAAPAASAPASTTAHGDALFVHHARRAR